MTTLPVLRRGAGGSPTDRLTPFVERLQHRLIAHRYPLIADGDFGIKTERQVKSFQEDEGLKVDGVVGEATWEALEQRIDEAESWAWTTPVRPLPEDAPSKPDFSPIVGNAGRQAVFGKFRYEPSPTPSNPEAIRFLDDWPRRNIVTVHVPQLARIPGVEYKVNDVVQTVGAGPKSGNVSCHRLVAKQLQALWQAWEDAGLLDRVITWAGMWSPRFIRGSRSVLSNHAFGSAFDCNASWNALGQTPAAIGKRGSVMELVSLAHEHGFYWGGFFSRKDGMHFECAKVL